MALLPKGRFAPYDVPGRVVVVVAAKSKPSNVVVPCFIAVGAKRDDVCNRCAAVGGGASCKKGRATADGSGFSTAAAVRFPNAGSNPGGLDKGATVVVVVV